MTGRAAGAALALAAVLAAPGSAASTAEAEIEMPEKLYVPRELAVLVGTTVTWRNTDRTTHTATADDDAFDSGHLRPGESFSRRFAEGGTFLFHCTIHRFMRGSVSVFQVVLTGPQEPVGAGRSARLEGIAPEGAIEVVLERVRPSPQVVVGRVVPSEDGSFAFGIRAPEPRTYVAHADGVASPTVVVRVAPRVSIRGSGPGLTIAAQPPRPGSVVLLQRYDRERFGFVTVVRTRLDSSSRVGIAYTPRSREHVRAVVRGGRGWSDGASRVVVVRPR